MTRTAEINIKVILDDKNMPVKITWDATDSGSDKPMNTEALMLSLWDKDNRNTLGIDLWTEEMLVDDMKVYFFQTIFKMADTFERATNNKEAANLLKKYANEFAEYLNSEKK